MRRFALLLSVLITLWGSLPAAATLVRLPDGDARVASVAVILPDTATQARAEELARRLAGMRAMTVLLSPESLDTMSCETLGAALAQIAHDSLADAGLAAIAPVLVGLGQGADAALAAAEQAPSAFKGLATFDARPGPCAGATGDKAPIRWNDVASAPRLAGLAGVRHYDRAPDPQHALEEAYLSIAGTDHAFHAAPAEAGLTDLPITLHPATGPGDTYAIFLSGDGGWANFDEEVSDLLAAEGIPVVGLSTLKYLWKKKTPAEIAADVARTDAHYGPKLGRSRLLLIGFSLGANVTPFYAPLLPESVRTRVRGAVLLSPERRTGFEVVIGGWLGRATGTHDVQEAITQATGAPTALRVLCLYGTKDRGSACPGLPPEVSARALPGGHHMDGDYDGIMKIVTDFAD